MSNWLILEFINKHLCVISNRKYSSFQIPENLSVPEQTIKTLLPLPVVKEKLLRIFSDFMSLLKYVNSF